MAKIAMKKCDICGVKYSVFSESTEEKCDRNYFIRFGTFTQDSVDGSEYYDILNDEYKDIDLCDECAESFKVWMKARHATFSQQKHTS